MRLSIFRKFHATPIALLVGMLSVMVLSSGCQPFSSWSCSLPQMPWKRSQMEPPVPALPTYSTFVSPLFASTPPRRVVIIEAGPGNGNYDASPRMITELASKIRSARLFEAIVPTSTTLQSHMDNILNGKFNEVEVSQLARQYNADAVAFVRVNELRGYAPMRVGITLAIVDSNETVVAFAVDGNWDTGNKATRQAFADYVRAESASVPGNSEVQLQSPRALLAFASSQIVEAINGSIR